MKLFEQFIQFYGYLKYSNNNDTIKAINENLYTEDDDDYIFDDELDTDFDENIQEEKDGNEEETDNENDYDY